MSFNLYPILIKTTQEENNIVFQIDTAFIRNFIVINKN